MNECGIHVHLFVGGVTSDAPHFHITSDIKLGGGLGTGLEVLHVCTCFQYLCFGGSN